VYNILGSVVSRGVPAHLSVDNKLRVFKVILSTVPTSVVLRKIARMHGLPWCGSGGISYDASVLHNNLCNHSCTDTCIVSLSDAHSIGILYATVEPATKGFPESQLLNGASESIHPDEYFISVSLNIKAAIIVSILDRNPQVLALRILISKHAGILSTHKTKKAELISLLENHSCSDISLISLSDLQISGIDATYTELSAQTVRLVKSQLKELKNVGNSKKRNIECTDSTSTGPPAKRPRGDTSAQSLNLTNILGGDIFVELSIENKQIIFDLILQLNSSVLDLHKLALFHSGVIVWDPIAQNKYTKAPLLGLLKKHKCSDICLFTVTSLQMYHPGDKIKELLHNDVVLIKKKLQDLRSISICQPGESQHKFAQPSNICFDTNIYSLWPQINTLDVKKKIIEEFCEITSTSTLATKICSFCGCLELESKFRIHACDAIDISLLVKCVESLCISTQQKAIQAYDLKYCPDGFFLVCHKCQERITGKKFVKVPLYSYANNCWIGELPEVLQGLTLLEEECIARAWAAK